MPAAQTACAQEEFEGWDLEPSLRQAHLVMVARVSSISRLTVVEGAKTDVALREYRFQPVRRLMGIFQRDELSMTATDLGCPAEDALSAPPLKEGEFRLLILAQQKGFTLGCVAAAKGIRTFEQRVPLLSGADDPLVATVETLIETADSRSRSRSAKLLLDRLADIEGRAAIPLLSSLKQRADRSADDRRAFGIVSRLTGAAMPAVRDAAIDLLRDMLASGAARDDSQPVDEAAESIRRVIDDENAGTDVRLAALDALGRLVALDADLHRARDLLIAQLSGAATHAERAAAAAALARTADPEAETAVLNALAALPLDEPAAREAVYARAAVKLDAAGAETILLTRLERSIGARQSLEAEIDPLGEMRSKASLPLLLAAAGRRDVSAADRYHLARALGRLRDDRAIPVLVGWMRQLDFRLKNAALAALEEIDSQEAAREAQPLLKPEPQLTLKLRLARLLARHGIADGYSLATEHLADRDHTAGAALVLVALDDARTSSELTSILSARPDRNWRAAALTGLVAVGDTTAKEQLLEILSDDRNPLAADAAEAAGLSADGGLLLPLAALVESRNRTIAQASLTALQRFLSGVRTAPSGLAAANDVDDEPPTPSGDVSPETRAALAEAVASLAVDTYVDLKLRQEAFGVAGLLQAERYPELLTELTDQSELEGTPLLTAVIEAARRQRGLDE